MSAPDFSAVSLVFLTAGNIDVPGAPVLNLALLYDGQTGAVSGEALVTQAIAPPDGRLLVRSVSGEVHGLGIGGATRVMSLRGEYIYTLPAPAIGSISEKFEANFVMNQQWVGHGSFQYGGKTIQNVPIKPRG
ncbi:DUF1842 domain-containing protein [Massilia niastensis]|uniref:DUF1842 domain-containing protein n=1 Tax=Massilia niastensis TaxID=544911 RepID=UPI000475854F|nr:DUF1842 domain-containing protein [Massilia niastensis]